MLNSQIKHNIIYYDLLDSVGVSKSQDLKYIIESVLESEQLEEEQNESLAVENVNNNSPNEKDYKKEIAVLLGFDSLYFCLLMEVIDQFPEPWKSPLVHCEKILNRNSVVY